MNVPWTWASPSNMWRSNGPQDQEKVTCNSTPYPYFAYEYSKNFFLNNKCPNLVLNLKKEELAECAGKTIVAKLEAPLIITDYFNKIIDKDGNNTEINYYLLKSFLNKDGTTIEECGGNEMCQKYAKILDKILWVSDKEVKLTIPGNEVDDKTKNDKTKNGETKDDKTEDDETEDDETEDDETEDDETDNNGETQDDDSVSTTSNNLENSYYSEIQNELLSSYSHSGNDLI